MKINNEMLVRTYIAFFLVGMLLLLHPTAAWAHAQTASGLRATSAAINSKGETYIVLYWDSVSDVSGYNLYRKGKRDTAYPKFPVNGNKPIALVGSCAELQTIIKKGSAEWKKMENAFASLSVQSQAGTKDKKKAVKTAESPVAAAAQIGPVIPGMVIIDPCRMVDVGLTTEQLAIFDMLAAANLKLRRARGLAFIDRTVKANQEYTYQLRGVTREKKEAVVGQPVTILAGSVSKPGPPPGITLQAGDSKVLLLWERRQDAFSYMVRRASNSKGPFRVIHSTPIFFDIEKDLEGKEIISSAKGQQAQRKKGKPGFVDYRRWTKAGKPTSHKVKGVKIDGPQNNRTYYYQVASRDILERRGNWSTAKSAIPKDTTPPKAPTDFKVSASKSPPGLVLSWRKVTHDIKGHVDQDKKHYYKIYRADALEKLQKLNPNGTLPSVYFVKQLHANPQGTLAFTLQWWDTDTSLVPVYGEKDYWYRVICVDANKNHSAPSAAISGRIPDTTPPGSTTLTGSKGAPDHITVYWESNHEPDLGGYQVYRSICNKGKVYRPIPPGQDDYLPCNFVLLKEILKEEAEDMIKKTNRIYYNDYSLSKKSPLCYAYWVRAFDQSRNLYMGDRKCPAGVKEYVCQKLYEKTAPPPPIISVVKARNNGVSIKWVSSPIQDLRAFHVYRSESPTGQPVFRACVYTDGTVKTQKWQGLKPSCRDIPAETNPKAVTGSYLDKNVEPHQVFWYRVAGVDWLGNESSAGDISKIPAISTFTFSKNLPITPTISSVKLLLSSAGCGLTVYWNPAFDASKLKGFLVFRSAAAAGPFRQVSPPVKGNNFTDKSAIPGKTYWYRVQAMDTAGKLSQASPAVKYKYSKK
jgi:fibronectin type 3 domain-containing protein